MEGVSLKGLAGTATRVAPGRAGGVLAPLVRPAAARKAPASFRSLRRTDRRGRKQRLHAAGGSEDEFDPFAEADDTGPSLSGMKKDPIIMDRMVQEEADAIWKLFSQISAMQPKYPSFDVEGKKLFLQMMEDLGDKLT